jgi:hypothetical protein
MGVDIHTQDDAELYYVGNPQDILGNPDTIDWQDARYNPTSGYFYRETPHLSVFLPPQLRLTVNKLVFAKGALSALQLKERFEGEDFSNHYASRQICHIRDIIETDRSHPRYVVTGERFEIVPNYNYSSLFNSDHRKVYIMSFISPIYR